VKYKFNEIGDSTESNTPKTTHQLILRVSHTTATCFGSQDTFKEIPMNTNFS
jgi:hypothetical protein